ncbi:MAG TPA: hypothetical protein VF945_14880 [Polyangia bacterium]
MRLLFILTLCLGCNQQNFVELVPVEQREDPTTGAGGPAGFACRLPCPCSDGSSQCSCLLFERAANAARSTATAIGLNPDFAGAHAMGSAVVDFLSLGQGPSDSDPFVVIARCTQYGPCVPIARQCFPLDLTLARDVVDSNGPTANGTLLADIFTQLHQSGALVSADAPDQELLIRMVTTSLSCDQIAQLPLRLSQWPVDKPDTKWGEAIFGCGYAGPFHLDAEHGDVFLGLPTLDTVNCVPQAAVCAADFNPQQAAPLLGF